MNRKGLASLFLVVLSVSVFAGVLSTVEASPPSTEFCIELVTHVSTSFTRFEDVDLNRDGVDDFRIIEALRIWNFTGTLEGTVALDIFLIGEIPDGPLFILGNFEITADGGTVQIQGKFSMRQTGWDPGSSTGQGTFFGHGDMKVKGVISVGYGTDVMVWEGISW